MAARLQKENSFSRRPNRGAIEKNREIFAVGPRADKVGMYFFSSLTLHVHVVSSMIEMLRKMTEWN